MKYQKLNHSSNLHFYTMNHVDSPKKKKKAMNHVIGRYSFFFLNNLKPPKSHNFGLWIAPT